MTPPRAAFAPLTSLSRRGLMAGASMALAGAVLGACAGGSRADNRAAVDRYANDPWRALTPNDWRGRLSADAFRVLREEGTELAGSSPLNGEKRVGQFHCAGCDLALFQSDKKFDSGTGWPSFFDVIPGAVGTKQDFKLFLPRTEYHCARCLGHQGHVFEDGPAPTGLRYCNNGVALTFRPQIAAPG